MAQLVRRPSSRIILRPFLSLFGVSLFFFFFWSFLAQRKREKEWKEEEAIDQPLTLSKLNKSRILHYYSSLLGPFFPFPDSPWCRRRRVCFVAVDVATHRQRQHIGVRLSVSAGFHQLVHCWKSVLSLSLSLVCLFTKEERQIVDKRKDLDRERDTVYYMYRVG